MAEEENTTSGGIAGLATPSDADDRDDAETDLTPGKTLLNAHIVSFKSLERAASSGPRRRRSLVQEIKDKGEDKVKHEIEKKVGKNLLKRIWDKVLGRGGAAAAEETAAEVTAAEATATESFFATSATGIAATFALAAVDVGLAIYDTKQIIELVHDTKEWNAEKAKEAEANITNFRAAALSYYHSKIGDKGHYDVNGSVVHYANGKTVDLADPKAVEEVKQDLQTQEAAQQKIIDANEPPRLVPYWAQSIYDKKSFETRELAGARMRGLKSAEGGSQLWQTAVANHQILSAPAAPASPAVGSNQTVVLGDSLASGCAQNCAGNVLNLAVVGSRINDPEGLMHQLSQAEHSIHKGDNVFILTGRNEVPDLKAIDLNKKLGAEQKEKQKEAYLNKYEADLEKAATKVEELQKATGANFVWGGAIPGGDADAKYVKEIRVIQGAVATKHHIKFVQSDVEFPRAADGMHPVNYHNVADVMTAGTGIKVKPPAIKAPHPQLPSHKAKADYSNIAGSSSSSTAHLNVPFTERQKYAFDLLVQKGLQNHISRQQSEIIAAGFVSNMVAESGANINDKAVGDSGSAHGIGQWHGDREKAFVKQHGYGLLDPRATIGQQVNFMWDEAFTGQEKAVGQHLLQAKSAHEAGAIVSAEYERPAAHDKEASNRGQIADNLHKHYAGTGDTALASNAPRPGAGARERLPNGVVAALGPQPQHPPTGKAHAPEEPHLVG